MEVAKWFPIHIHDWPNGIIDIPIAGALVDVEWDVQIVNNYYGWHKKWPEDPLSGLFYFMNKWSELALAKGIRLLPGAKINFSLENIDCIKDIKVIPELKSAGLISLQIFHNHSNDYYNKAYGLTENGKKLLRIAEKYGLIIDLSHLQEPGLYNVIRDFNGQCIFSHLVCDALLYWNINRRSNGLSDREILETNANLYGIPFVDDLISPIATDRCSQRSVSTENIADQIMHLVKLVGLKKVALGPDYFNYAMYYSISGIETNTVKTMDSSEGLSHLSKCLIDKGMTENQVEMVFWGNAINFFDSK